MPALEILEKMITFDTTNPPGNEKELSDWISGYLSPYGFEIKQPSCGENRKSLIARFSMGEGPKIILNGHLDVVPAGDGWNTNPFLPMIKNGNLYGRGSADMKGGVAAMIDAGVKIALENKGLCGEICLLFVADEEIMNLGTVGCRQEWLDASCVVIGEPTDMQIEIAHKGTARFEIDIRGKSCHSSMPWMGINAVEKAAKVIQAIEAYDNELKDITHPLLARPSIAVTMIAGGEKDNIIPGNCTICVDYRMIPGDTGEKAEHKLCQYLENIKEDDIRFDYTIRRYIDLAPGEISMNHPFVEQAKTVFQTTFERVPVVRDFPATCEQVLFVKEGIPTIIVGPGSIDQAHVANEFVPIGQLEDAVSYYEALARAVLKRNGVE